MSKTERIEGIDWWLEPVSEKSYWKMGGTTPAGYPLFHANDSPLVQLWQVALKLKAERDEIAATFAAKADTYDQMQKEWDEAVVLLQHVMEDSSSHALHLETADPIAQFLARIHNASDADKQRAQSVLVEEDDTAADVPRFQQERNEAICVVCKKTEANWCKALSTDGETIWYCSMDCYRKKNPKAYPTGPHFQFNTESALCLEDEQRLDQLEYRLWVLEQAHRKANVAPRTGTV